MHWLKQLNPTLIFLIAFFIAWHILMKDWIWPILARVGFEPSTSDFGTSASPHWSQQPTHSATNTATKIAVQWLGRLLIPMRTCQMIIACELPGAGVTYIFIFVISHECTGSSNFIINTMSSGGTATKEPGHLQTWWWLKIGKIVGYTALHRSAK